MIFREYFARNQAEHFMRWHHCLLMMQTNFVNGCLSHSIMKGSTVMLAPATGFYGTIGLGQKEVRLAYVLNTESINGAMDCLQKALQVYPGRNFLKNNAAINLFFMLPVFRNTLSLPPKMSG